MGLDRQLDEALRLARAAIQNTEIEKRRPLTEEELQNILQHEVKRR